MRTIKRNIVSALIFSRDGKLFQGMKDAARGGVYVDCWHIPGGGVDEGEDKIVALKREILEETGIDISSYRIELADDLGRGQSEKTLQDTGEKVLCDMVFNVYKVNIDDKDAAQIRIFLNDDLVKYAWIDVKDIANLKLTPPSIELFKRLGYLT